MKTKGRWRARRENEARIGHRNDVFLADSAHDLTAKGEIFKGVWQNLP
jgi:hypothetical protein